MLDFGRYLLKICAVFDGTVVSFQSEIFIRMRAALLAPILPRVMEKGESKEGSSHFDGNLSL